MAQELSALKTNGLNAWLCAMIPFSPMYGRMTSILCQRLNANGGHGRSSHARRLKAFARMWCLECFVYIIGHRLQIFASAAHGVAGSGAGKCENARGDGKNDFTHG